MVKDMTNAQKQAIGYALTASNTVIEYSALSASTASALNWVMSAFTSSSARSTWIVSL